MLFGSGKKRKFDPRLYSLSPDELAMERAACFNQPLPVKKELLIVKISMAVCIPLFSVFIYFSVPAAIAAAAVLGAVSFYSLHRRVSVRASLVPAISSFAGLALGWLFFTPLVSLVSDFIREYY
jgi:hypothetical protein